MTVFETHCVILLPSIIMWHFLLIFVTDSSRYQNYRLRCALDHIYTFGVNKKEETSSVIAPETEVTYRNKNFTVGIIKSEVNYHYTTYRIFINGDEAGMYHKLKHDFMHSYYFEPVNRRHKDEVVSIVHAANRKIRRQNKITAEKPPRYDDYSYFK